MCVGNNENGALGVNDDFRLNGRRVAIGIGAANVDDLMVTGSDCY